MYVSKGNLLFLSQRSVELWPSIGKKREGMISALHYKPISNQNWLFLLFSNNLLFSLSLHNEWKYCWIARMTSSSSYLWTMSHIIHKPHLEVDLPGPPIPPRGKKTPENLKLKYTSYKLLNGWMDRWMDGITLALLEPQPSYHWPRVSAW
jgi:hypothetical protein